MIEEVLKDGSKNPPEAAQTLRLYITHDLPIGGMSAHRRYFTIFEMLCTRVFGEIVADSKSEFKHEPGGWLSSRMRWRSTTTTTTTAANSTPSSYGSSPGGGTPRTTTTSIETDPVVQLLGPQKVPPKRTSNNTANNNNDAFLHNIIEACYEEMEQLPNILYQFPFLGMPKPLQQQFLLVMEAALVGNANRNNPMNTMLGSSSSSSSSMNQHHHHPNDQDKQHVVMSQNAYKLLAELMRCPPVHQDQIQMYQRELIQSRNQNVTQPVQLSPGYGTPPQPMVGISTNLTSSQQQQQLEKETTPKLKCSMLEYYLLLFIRFPLASPFLAGQQTTSLSQSGVNRHQVLRPRENSIPFGEKVYAVLFERYLCHFLKHTKFPTSEAEFSLAQRHSEFFLRVVISLWLESHVSLPSTERAVQAIRDRLQRTGIVHFPAIDLKMSYDLAFGTYEVMPVLARRCFRSLIVHLIADPTIAISVQEQYKNLGLRHWCLSPGITAMQQPFYNYIRGSFRHASIHTTRSTFYSALNAWLIWLEPWNVIHASTASARLMNSIPGTLAQSAAGPTITIPRSDRKSGYTKVWEPYLAANLFFYTVPLAIFLRRARELDFSLQEFSRSMDLLKRVFRVYTPEVIQALNNLTDCITNPSSGNSDFQKTVENHKSLLGDYAPLTLGDLSLESCQSDMQGLLEEIHMQHMKRVRDLGYLDKFAAYLEGLFAHGVVSGEEIAIKSLVERAKVIVGFPIGFDLLPSDSCAGDTNVSKDVATSSLRTTDGKLTDEGRQRLLAGQFKCKPGDVYYVGDRMQSRLRSHELSFLLTLTTLLSQWLNEKLGLLPPSSSDKKEGTFSKINGELQKNLETQGSLRGFRINLRWFADYRNLLFTAFLMVLLWRTMLK